MVATSFNVVLRKFKVIGSLKGDSRKYQVYFKEILRVLGKVSEVFQISFKGVLRKLHGCFKEDWRVFLESFKWVSSIFERSLKRRVLKGVS